jgi:Glycosyl hydrolase catalytic core
LAFSTHATRAAPLPEPARVAHVTLAHPQRGVASSRYLVSNPGKLAQLGATWAYDWSARLPPRTDGLDWVPMVWGAASVTHASLAALTADRRSGRARCLLGFNEPDSGAQSNLSPEQAAPLWPSLEKTGLSLGSPAPQVPTDGWLARFMSLARSRHLRVDFIALHYYQDFTNPDAVAQLRAQLITLHRQFNRPIWITEIGAIDLRSWGEPMLHAPTHAHADRPG